MPKPCNHYDGVHPWRVVTRGTGYTIDRTLWLYPELDYSSCLCDYEPEHDDDGSGPLGYYVRYLQAADAYTDDVRILWTVCGDGGFVEFAPVELTGAESGRDVLTFVHWPECATCGHPVDWFRLPVINHRFPELAAQLGWTPSPFQQTAPVRTMVEARPSWW